MFTVLDIGSKLLPPILLYEYKLLRDKISALDNEKSAEKQSKKNFDAEVPTSLASKFNMDDVLAILPNAENIAPGDIEIEQVKGQPWLIVKINRIKKGLWIKKNRLY